MTSETVRALPIVIPVGLAGAVCIVAAIVSLALDPPGWATAAGVAGLLVAAILAEAFPLPIEGVNAGATSLAIVSIVATGVIYGWQEAAVVGFVAMASVELARRRGIPRLVFNTGLYVCAAVLAGLAAENFNGDDLASIVLAASVRRGGVLPRRHGLPLRGHRADPRSRASWSRSGGTSTPRCCRSSS